MATVAELIEHLQQFPPDTPVAIQMYSEQRLLETTEKLYPERDHPALGALYVRHVEAMTAEGLHAKSAIAGQLAWRDAEIARLQAQVAELQREVSERRVVSSTQLEVVDALAGALRKIVDQDMSFLNGYVLSDVIKREDILAGRAALAAAGR